jgi:hypothetical protein
MSTISGRHSGPPRTRSHADSKNFPQLHQPSLCLVAKISNHVHEVEVTTDRKSSIAGSLTDSPAQGQTPQASAVPGCAFLSRHRLECIAETPSDLERIFFEP